MKTKIIIFFVIGILSAIAVSYCFCDSIWFNTIVNRILNHTVDWITTSLTISSILFMIQGFIVPYTKENVYDKESYIDYLKGFNGEKWKEKQYIPLNNLSDCLLFSILTSLLSAIFVLLGSLSCYFTVIAIFCGTLSMIGMFVSLYAMKQTFNHMFGKY